MFRTLRVRIVTAVLAALLLTVSAASPMVFDAVGLGSVAHAGECDGSSC